MCSDANTMTSKLVTQPRFRFAGKRTQTDPKLEEKKLCLMFIERITARCFLFPGFSKLIYKAKEIKNHKPDKFINVINITFNGISPDFSLHERDFDHMASKF